MTLALIGAALILMFALTVWFTACIAEGAGIKEFNINSALIYLVLGKSIMGGLLGIATILLRIYMRAHQ